MIVEKLAEINVADMKFAAYRVKDPITDEWSAVQYHAVQNNTVLAVISDSALKLLTYLRREIVGGFGAVGLIKDLREAYVNEVGDDRTEADWSLINRADHYLSDAMPPDKATIRSFPSKEDRYYLTEVRNLAKLNNANNIIKWLDTLG